MSRSKSTIIAGAILTVALGVTLAARAAVDSGIAGWWLFNESSGITAHDSSDAGNDGTLLSTALFTSDAERGNVLFVNGTSGEVDFPPSNELEPAVGTVSVWVKPAAAQLADIVRKPTDLLLRVNRPGNFYAYGLRVTSKGSPVAIIANDDPKTSARQPQLVVQGSANLVKVGKWTHLVMRWNGTALNLFANGKAAGSVRYKANPTLGLSYHGNAHMKVGSALWDSHDGYLEYFGMVSDLRIYSRALTDTEIRSIYNGQ